MNGASEDPIYTTQSDIKMAALKEAAEIKRNQLDAGYATKQGKKSGVENSKYDYMPATSYGQRFNRMGNSFFLNDPYYTQNGFAGNSSSNSRVSVFVQVGSGFSPMYNPYINNYGYNPWRCGYNDPYRSYSMMQTSYYPFFTYNPYMYSYNYIYGYSSPWMMQNSFYDPYFYNPYYSYNPYAYNNPYCNTYRTSSRSPSPTYVNQRRNSSVGGNSSTSGGNNSNTSYSRDRTTNTSSEKSSSTRTNTESSGSRGGYNTNNRTDRGSTTTHQGSTRR